MDKLGYLGVLVYQTTDLPQLTSVLVFDGWLDK